MEFQLPIAPTSNNAYANRRFGKGKYGRVKSATYHRWKKQADGYYTLQGLGRVPPVLGRYICTMVFPNKRWGDLDGRQKLILDWLVSRRLVEGDSPLHLRALNTRISDEPLMPGQLVTIQVTPCPSV